MSKKLVIRNYEINAPILDILLEIKKQSSCKILDNIKPKGKYISIPCPFHKEGKERRNSCGVFSESPILDESTSSLEYGWFNCFTCGESGPLYKLVGKCFEENDAFGKKWLIDNFGEKIDENVDDINNQLVDDDYIPIRNISVIDTKRITSSTNNIECIDESILDTYESYHPYMTQRKLSNEVIKKFQIKYDKSTNSIIFPVYNEDNKLIMLTKRSVKGKKFFIDKDVEKPIYLLNYVTNKKISYAIVCESQINALYCHSLGLSAIATFGCNITKKQFDILNNSSIKYYIVAFDGDSAGKHGTQKFIANIRRDVIVDIVVMPDGKDLNDLNEEELKRIFKDNNINYEYLINNYKK